MKGINQIFVINLERRPDRLQEFNDRAIQAGLSLDKITTIKAVDGDTLKGDSPSSFKLRDDLIIEFNNTPHQLFEGNDFNYRCGVMGCALSHLALYKHISGLPDGRYMIFEDDVHFFDGFIGRWNTIVEQIPDDIDFVYLGGSCYVGMLRKVYNSVLGYPSLLDRQYQCTFSYCITPKGARTLLDLILRYKMKRAIDWVLRDFYRAKDIILYQTIPELCYCPQNYKSDIQFNTKRVV